MSEKKNPQTTAIAYLESVGRKDFETFERLLSSDVTFHGPAGDVSGSREVSAAYRRLAPILVSNELKKSFVDGSEVCIIYDFVTNTAVGAVPTVEWLKIEDGRVRSIWLLTDHLRWPKALGELQARLQQQGS